MSVITLFRPCGVGNFEWVRLPANAGAATPECEVGDAERLTEEAVAGSMVLIAPAEKVGLRAVDFDASEKKLLRQTVPYSMEDELAEDVDSLHFALGRIGEGVVDVAYVKREQLQHWQQQLGEQQIELQQVVSELQLLPCEEGSWTLLVTDTLWLVRYGLSQGFAMDADTARLGLQLLLDDTELPPQKLLVYADASVRDAVSGELPEMLRGIVEWREEDYWEMVARGFAQTQAAINLLQGEYAPSLPWKKWWKTWKVSAVLVLAAVIVNILFSFISIQVLESRNYALRAETERIYRSVVPRGAVMRPAQQLRRKVEELGGGGGERFMPLLERTATVLTAVQGVELQTLNYSEKQSELRLTILANGFNDVETVRANLEKAGLVAELGGSNAEGNKTRARLRIKS